MRHLTFQIQQDIDETDCRLRAAMRSRKVARPHLDDDEETFVESNLERWADRGFRDPAWDWLKH